MIRTAHTWLPVLMSLCAPGTAAAVDLHIRITDQHGAPLSDAVVESALVPLRQAPGEIAVMDQVDKRFVPMVIAIHQGQSVNFPNNDNIRHHVYSFSPIKQFSTELYADVHGEPVLFDKAGVAVLGCNIHDSMIGYIYVSGFEHVTVTGSDGMAHFTFERLPETVSVWHPWSTDPDNRLDVSTAGITADGTLQVTLPVTPPEQVFGFRALNGAQGRQ